MDELARQLTQLVNNSPVQWLIDPFPESIGIRLVLKRDDLLHPLVSGNKWRKLKYNLLEARQQGLDTLLTFGGAYSNHLYAVAAAGKVFGFKTIGMVRGDELANVPRNPTLQFCESCGMNLHFVSRAEYRRKEEADYVLSLTRRFNRCYVLPEGGTNEQASRGTAEIIPELTAQLGLVPDYVCCPVGTGGTVSGLIASAQPETTVMGFLALKAPDFQLSFDRTKHANFQLEDRYAFGGYAKTTPQLLSFIQRVERKTGILFEQVYTGKMLYGLYDLARQGYFPEGATVVVIHTGGLQGRSPALNHLIEE